MLLLPSNSNLAPHIQNSPYTFVFNGVSWFYEVKKSFINSINSSFYVEGFFIHSTPSLYQSIYSKLSNMKVFFSLELSQRKILFKTYFRFGNMYGRNDSLFLPIPLSFAAAILSLSLLLFSYFSFFFHLIFLSLFLICFNSLTLQFYFFRLFFFFCYIFFTAGS